MLEDNLITFEIGKNYPVVYLVGTLDDGLAVSEGARDGSEATAR